MLLDNRIQMKIECFCCKKRLTLVNHFICKCNHTFCSQHRYIETHNCPKMKDIIHHEKQLLQEQLIKLEQDKMNFV